MTLINYFIEKGAHDWNRGLGCAVTSGNPEIIEFFTNKGITDYQYALEAAVISDNIEYTEGDCG